METLENNFNKNRALDMLNYFALTSCAFLFIITQTFLWKNIQQPITNAEYVMVVLLTIITFIRFFQLDKDGRIDWIKTRSFAFVYILVRLATVSPKAAFFEGMYLLALSNLTVNTDFLKKVVLRLFIIYNFLLNALVLAAHIYFGFNVDRPIYHLEVHQQIKRHIFAFPGVLYNNINSMGVVTAFALLVALALFFENKDKMKSVYKVLFGLYVAFSAYCIYFSRSRSAALTIIVCLAILIVNEKLKIEGKKIVLTLLAVCVLFVFCAIGFIVAHWDTGMEYADYPDYHHYTDLETKIHSISSSRYSIWKNSLYSAVENEYLAFGVGSLGKEHTARDKYKIKVFAELTGNADGYSPMTYAHPHNGYITMLVCTGIVGTIAFAFAIRQKIKNSELLDSGIWYIVVCYIVMLNEFEVVVTLHKRAIMFILMAILAAGSTVKYKQED